MSNLIENLIPLFGEYQTVNGKKIRDERLKLFIWMSSNDISRMNKYLMHGDGATTWINTPAKNLAYPGLTSNNIDPEIVVLINDFANRVQTLDKSSVINNLNKLAGKDLDSTAQAIITSLFATINGNKPSYKIPSPVTECTYNGVTLILNNFLNTPDFSAGISQTVKTFIDECHNRTPLIFTYQIDEYLARRVLQEVSTTNISVGSSFLSDLDSSLTVSTHEFYRKPEDLSKLWTKENGVEVEVQRGSQRMNQQTKNGADCHGHQVNNDGAETCHRYLEECLNGNDISKCRDFMKSKNFWGNAGGSAKTELKGMLPATALATLEKFGFRQINVFDSVAKRNIFKVETVSSWLENLSKTITDTSEYNAIKSNENLIKYLTLLEVKINASPEILNKGITSSDGTITFNPNKFYGQYASQVGIRAKIPVASVVGPYKRFSNTLTTYGITGSNIVSPKFMVPIRVGGVMHGGSISDYVSKLDENYKFASSEFENQYKSFKNALNGAGKTIDPVDDKALTDLLESFKKSEKKIVISLKLIEKYLQLMDVFKNNDPRGVLTLSNLDLLVSTNKTQVEKGSKKQESLINALTTLSSIVENAVNVAKPGSVSLVPGSFTGSSFSHEN